MRSVVVAIFAVPVTLCDQTHALEVLLGTDNTILHAVINSIIQPADIDIGATRTDLLQKANFSKYDLIILDTNLTDRNIHPDKPLVDEIGDSQNSPTPILAVTHANDDPYEIAVAGFTDSIQVPLNIGTFLQKVNTLVY
eukprot:Clim_evm3s99 gene=Clim_evmTU3s99